MASESRITPKSNKTREAALDSGQAKQTAMGLSSFITAPTATLLSTTQLAYSNARAAINVALAVFFNATHDKDKKAVTLEMVCSHFIQVFVLAVKRGVYKVGDLAYYGLTESGTLPDMGTEAKMLAVAKKLIKGDADRMAVPGAVAMAMPPIADVTAAKIAFETADTATNNADEVVKKAQVACNNLNDDADKTIKFLWGEVETHYSDLPRVSMRDEARLWGVIYSKVGGIKIISGTVKDKDTGEIIIGATVFLSNGNNESESDTGGYKFDTTLMEAQTLVSEHPLYVTLDTPVTLLESENLVVDLLMVKKV